MISPVSGSAAAARLTGVRPVARSQDTGPNMSAEARPSSDGVARSIWAEMTGLSSLSN